MVLGVAHYTQLVIESIFAIITLQKAKDIGDTNLQWQWKQSVMVLFYSTFILPLSSSSWVDHDILN